MLMRAYPPRKHSLFLVYSFPILSLRVMTAFSSLTVSSSNSKTFSVLFIARGPRPLGVGGDIAGGASTHYHESVNYFK